MLPVTMSPELIPMRMCMSCTTFGHLSPSLAHFLRSFMSLLCMSHAALQALWAWFSRGMGAPKNAMMASPSYLSSVPLLLRSVSVIAVRYSFSKSTSRLGSPIFSENVEKLAISVKYAVMFDFSPPSVGIISLFTISSISSGEMYCLNAPSRNRFSLFS